MWKMKRDFQIDFLRERGLSPNHYLLDIGCGTLRGGIPLIEFLEPGHYYGVESREDVIDEGRQELKKERLETRTPVLIAAEDIAKVEIEQDFEYVWAFSVLIHMTDEILSSCLGFVAGRLRPEGVFYANVNIGEAPPGNWQGFPVMYRSLATYSALCAQRNLRVTDIGSLEEIGHVSGDEAQDQQRMLEIRHA
jgi:SAM-dependent methyltransferase